jgi:hypothetical protein
VKPSGAERPSASATALPSAREAQLAVSRLVEMSADVRGGAVLDGDGNALAASGDPEPWGRAGADLLAAADAAEGGPATSVHVATEEGEAYAVRAGELAMVAVTDRFALASLILFDIRSVLRDLAAGRAGVDRCAPGPGAEARARRNGDSAL